MIYLAIFLILLACELIYFKIADRCNIIDKPNERSSHSTIVLRGGGIIFLIGAWVWAIVMVSGGFCGFQEVSDCYPFFLLGLTLVAGMSFVDDIRSLPDSVRLIAQIVGMALMFYQMGLFGAFQEYGTLVTIGVVLAAFFISVGATNVINFMDGINGITAVYSLAVLIPLAVLNGYEGVDVLHGDLLNSSNISNLSNSSNFSNSSNLSNSSNFVDPSFITVIILSVLVFCIFNFRPKGKAKCFAGDVGSIGMAFILLFLIGTVVVRTMDLTYMIFIVVYGVDGCLTIIHRIMLHENLGEAHRKHAFQLMCNELKMGHVTVSLLYAILQLAISLGFILFCPDTVAAHWIYLVITSIVLFAAYILFMRKYYHLHEEYLASLKG